MSWGATFNNAYQAASSAARATADKAMSSASEVAKAVGRAAQAVAGATRNAAVAVGSAAKTTAIATASAATNAAVAVGSAAKTAAIATASAATTVVKGTATVAGELVNTGVGLGTTLAASKYRMVKNLFGGSDTSSKLIQQCPQKTPVDISTHEYRKGLINSKFEGQGTDELRDAMVALRKQPLPDSEAEPHLKKIAASRKRPIDEIRAEYKKFVKLNELNLENIREKPGEYEEIDELKPSQQKFMGSDWQMRYGKVAGDALGIDPVFGAMLNPTGGLVGPGNKGLAPDGALMPEAVAYHGAYHDAMGHLYTYHKEGPGYNYMKSPIGLNKGSPYAGQATGIAEFSSILALY